MAKPKSPPIDEYLKYIVGSQKKLAEILQVGSVQAWKIWTGKSGFSPVRERYLAVILKEEIKRKEEEMIKINKNKIEELEKIVTKSFQ